MFISMRETDTHVYFLGGPLSNWAPLSFVGHLPILETRGSEFIIRKGNVFNFKTNEHYMMAAKAALFNDHETLLEILTVKLPSDAKALGRKVKNFDETIWKQFARTVVFIGNYYKALQNPEYKDWLLSTEKKIIVEGSSKDSIWGVKLDYSDPLIEDERNWKGTNWLGEVHEKTRNYLRFTETPITDPWELSWVSWKN